MFPEKPEKTVERERCSLNFGSSVLIKFANSTYLPPFMKSDLSH